MQKKLSTIILSVLFVVITAIPTMASSNSDCNLIRTSNGNIYYYSALATRGPKYNAVWNTDLSFVGKGEIGVYYGGKNDYVTSSDTKVATIYKRKNTGIKNKLNYYVKIKKTGGTLITRHTRNSLYLRINSYKDACKSFKIGNKEYANNFKYKPIMSLGLKKGKKLKGKVVVKPKKGWKLVRIQMKSTTPVKYNYKYYYKIVKNKSTVTLNGFNAPYENGIKNFKISAVFQSEKTKEYSFAEIYTGPIRALDGLTFA